MCHEYLVVVFTTDPPKEHLRFVTRDIITASEAQEYYMAQGFMVMLRMDGDRAVNCN